MFSIHKICLRLFWFKLVINCYFSLILLNYAVSHPDINYIQGMSDLLAPLLSTLRDEALSYWCFVNLMEQTLFCLAPASETRNVMEINLEYLRELLKLLVPDFFSYLLSLGGDAPQLMFVHRWILLFFKREFPEADALHLWEVYIILFYKNIILF